MPDHAPRSPMRRLRRLALALAIIAIAGGSATLTATKTPAGATEPSAPIDAFRGLGAWVDIFDGRAWNDPRGLVRDLAAKHVRTLYVQTGNYGSRGPIFRRAALNVMIQRGHAAGIKVVAWYLPGFTRVGFDVRRSMAAIRYRTPGHQRFDGFGMDIEATMVRSIRTRNARLVALSRRVRKAAGPRYPLGAIIPAPVQIVWSRRTGFWPRFPYRRVAATYDVFLPMGYYSYWGSGRVSAYRITRRDTRLIRRKTGRPSMPVHPIGGLASRSTAPETAGFARGARRSGCIGASMYDWASSQRSDWRVLQRVWGHAAPKSEHDSGTAGTASSSSSSPHPAASPGAQAPSSASASPAATAAPAASASPAATASPVVDASPAAPASFSATASPSPTDTPSASSDVSPSPAPDWSRHATPAQITAGLKVLRLVLPRMPRVPAPSYRRD